MSDANAAGRIEPCVYCGSTDTAIDNDDGPSHGLPLELWRRCSTCWAQGPIARTYTEADRRWNHRLGVEAEVGRRLAGRAPAVDAGLMEALRKAAGHFESFALHARDSGWPATAEEFNDFAIEARVALARAESAMETPR